MASPSSESHQEKFEFVSLGEESSDLGETADDLFAPIDSRSDISNSSSQNDQFDKNNSENWADPFQQAEEDFRNTPSKRSLQKNTPHSFPENAMAGWEQDSSRTQETLAVANSPQNTSRNDFSQQTNPYRPDSARRIRPTTKALASDYSRNNQERSLPVQPASHTSTKSLPSEKSIPESRNSSTSNKPLTWSSAVEELNQLGIRQFRLQPGERPNEFHFTCFFTPRDNPRITHRFEAEATEPLRAVQKVLDQIHEWLENR